MTNPPVIAAVPWADAEALRELIEAKPDSVTPLMLERLLEQYRFECLGDVPSQGPVRAAAWAPRDRASLATPATFTVVVYHTELVVRDRVVQVLRVLQALARARAGVTPGGSG